MPVHKGKIMVVEDSKTTRQILEQILKERGYEVVLATSGREALELIQKDLPDLIILDLGLPDMDGFTVAKYVRSDPGTYHVPIIVLTALDKPGFEVRAIDAGADDFITKPPDPQVLDARINMIIRRSQRERLANSLSGLPGSILIDKEISSRLSQGNIFCLNYVDLDNFKHFNDKYGYQRGDEVILLTAGIIKVAIKKFGNKEDFIGHIGGDDLIFLTTPDKVKPIAKWIIKEFDLAIPIFYDKSTRKKGFSQAIDRQGNKYKVPILTISIATVDNAKREFKSSIEMVDALTELKHYAKGLPGSNYVSERRKLKTATRKSA